MMIRDTSARVCVIGAGPSGITAGKNLLQAGLRNIVIYEKGEDEAAITVSAWAGESLSPGVAEYMREAKTAIGAAWRP